jgi:hypothetical protein
METARPALEASLDQERELFAAEGQVGNDQIAARARLRLDPRRPGERLHAVLLVLLDREPTS